MRESGRLGWAAWRGEWSKPIRAKRELSLRESFLPRAGEKHIELGSLERSAFGEEVAVAKAHLLAEARKEVWIPSVLAGHGRRGVGCGGLYFCKLWKPPGSAKPIAGVVEIAFPPVHHAVPIAPRGAGV